MVSHAILCALIISKCFNKKYKGTFFVDFVIDSFKLFSLKVLTGCFISNYHILDSWYVNNTDLRTIKIVGTFLSPHKMQFDVIDWYENKIKKEFFQGPKIFIWGPKNDLKNHNFFFKCLLCQLKLL